jgi:glucose 1-dehydrogenase
MRALVTGASRGIGRSICLRIARDALARGDKPHIVASGTGRSDDLKNIVAELRDMGVRADGVAGDLTDPEVPPRLVAETLGFCGGLDALVHNAGYPIPGTLLDVKVRHWDLMFAINVRAMMLLGRAAHPALKESGGSLVAIASVAAEEVSHNLTGYSPSKAALVMLVRLMAAQWGPDGIRANCVSPGVTHSRSTEKAFANAEVVAERESHLPLRRLGRPEDIAAAVSFLVGPDAAYITGENVNVDGGLRQIKTSAIHNVNWAREKNTS